MNFTDSTVLVALIATGGVILTAGGTLLGVFITRGTEMKKLLVGAPTGYAALVDDLQQERVDSKAERAELRTERSLLLARVEVLTEDVASLTSRTRGLEVEMDSERKRTVILLVHIGELRSALRRAGITPPPAPEGSGVEDSGPLPAVTSTTTTTTTSTT